jgi:predicted nucleotide-binding protein
VTANPFVFLKRVTAGVIEDWIPVVTRKPSPPVAVPPSVLPSVGLTLVLKLIEKAIFLQEKEDLESSDLDGWHVLAKDYLARAFGSESANIRAVVSASGDYGMYADMSEQALRANLISSLRNKVKVLRSCVEQLELNIELAAVPGATAAAPVPASPAVRPTKVFIVHGHNSGIKDSVARVLQTLGLKPIILHEQPNGGRTVFEKFSAYADVSFAVVLMTADDVGKAKAEPGDVKPRARQNVILELGYFLCRLGPSKVCALYESGVEIPSDYQGVLFTELDANGHWRYDLVKELRAAGFDVDANRL